MLVAALMSDKPVTIDAYNSAEAAHELAQSRRVHHLLVMQDGELGGLACLCDLDDAWPRDIVARLMHRLLLSLSPDDPVELAVQIMEASATDCLVVADHGRLAGVVTRRDLRRHGFLPNERGIDRCAACGSSHHLLSAGPGIARFCAQCIEHTAPPAHFREMYYTTGGGD
jgi:signal-transduction protein with cAMP-binding, CBS, and nucleotidyltransferase domain